jgi:hypothetical protein
MNPDAQTILKKTQAFLRGLEATLDEFIAKTIARGESLLEKDKAPEPQSEAEPSRDVAS